MNDELLYFPDVITSLKSNPSEKYVRTCVNSGAYEEMECYTTRI